MCTHTTLSCSTLLSQNNCCEVKLVSLLNSHARTRLVVQILLKNLSTAEQLVVFLCAFDPEQWTRLCCHTTTVCEVKKKRFLLVNTHTHIIMFYSTVMQWLSQGKMNFITEHAHAHNIIMFYSTVTRQLLGGKIGFITELTRTHTHTSGCADTPEGAGGLRLQRYPWCPRLPLTGRTASGRNGQC